MSFLVTGSSSYVGKYIINHLLLRNYKVIGTSRTNPNISNKNFIWVKHDLSHSSFKIKKKIDYVVHAAGQGWMNKKTENYVNSNIFTTYYISQMIKKIKPKCTFYISSRDIYGKVNSKKLKENNSVIDPIVYGHTKFIAENLIKENGPFIILRFPSIIGIGTHGWIDSIVKKLKKNKKVEFVNTKFNNFIHASEIPKIILSFCKKKKIKSNIFLLGCSNTVSSKKIIFLLKKNLKSKSKIIQKIKKGKFYTISINKIKKIYKPMTVEKTIDLFSKEIKISKRNFY